MGNLPERLAREVWERLEKGCGCCMSDRDDAENVAKIKKAIQAALDEARQIAVDECWLATDMRESYGKPYHDAANKIAVAIEALKGDPS